MGVTEHIEGDECKFATWTGRTPMAENKVILKATSIEVKQVRFCYVTNIGNLVPPYWQVPEKNYNCQKLSPRRRAEIRVKRKTVSLISNRSFYQHNVKRVMKLSQELKSWTSRHKFLIVSFRLLSPLLDMPEIWVRLDCLFDLRSITQEVLDIG